MSEDETNGEIDSDLPIKKVTESGLAYKAVVNNVQMDTGRATKEVHDNVCADSGATGDVIGMRDKRKVTSITEVDDITLIGIGGNTEINQVGDCMYKDELKIEQG